MTEQQPQRYTTEQAAQKLGRNLGTVRNYVSRLNLGVWIGDQRFLSDADLAQIRRAAPGRPRSPNYKPRARRAAAAPSPATDAPQETTP